MVKFEFLLTISQVSSASCITYSIDEQLVKLFSKYGEVRNVNIIKGKRFGFIEMSNKAEAERAKEALDGTEFEGRILIVDEARIP